MKKILFAFTFLISLHGYSQKYYLKFVNPSIIGPIVIPDFLGTFELDGAGYEILSTEGKVKPGLLRFSLSENSKLPDIWNVFYANSQPINIEIYSSIIVNNVERIFLTLKVSNSYINAISFNSNGNITSSTHDLEIWINQISFQYIEYATTGSILGYYSTGWDFKTNKAINF